MIFFLFNCLYSQSRINLESLKLNKDHPEIFKQITKQVDLEQTSGLAYYSTSKVEQFAYDSVNFTQNYPKAKNYHKSTIGFLVNNTQENLLIGYYISTKNFEETDKLISVLKKKYGEPKVIFMATENWPYSAYYWQNTKDGLDILLNQIKKYSASENKQINGFETNLYFMKTGLHYGNMNDRETILQSFIKRNQQ